MFKRIGRWYREWEAEQLAVLQNPGLASQAPAGYRRHFACKIAAMSPQEREDLYRFSVATRGTTLWVALLALCALLSALGMGINLAFRPATPWLYTVLAANAIGLALALSLFGVWFNYRRVVHAKLRTLLTMVGLGVLGGLVGGLTSKLDEGRSWPELFEMLSMTVLITTLGLALLVALPTLVVAILRNRHHETVAAQLRRDAEQERLARELSETQLRLLRAQIEPHFLFNTLGAVQQLAETGAPRAAELTSHLIDFLRASMSEMRCEQVDLATEFGLVESYLRVMQIRMGERLRFKIDLPDALSSVQLPSMVVLTLAENAIKHGIEPALRGGEISVGARLADGAIRIQVGDSGVGMSDTPGDGTGLDNVRRRLRLACGDGAALALSEAEPGLLAEIVIPRKEPQ